MFRHPWLLSISCSRVAMSHPKAQSTLCSGATFRRLPQASRYIGKLACATGAGGLSIMLPCSPLSGRSQRVRVRRGSPSAAPLRFRRCSPPAGRRFHGSKCAGPVAGTLATRVTTRLPRRGRMCLLRTACVARPGKLRRARTLAPLEMTGVWCGHMTSSADPDGTRPDCPPRCTTRRRELTQVEPHKPCQWAIASYSRCRQVSA